MACLATPVAAACLAAGFGSCPEDAVGFEGGLEAADDGVPAADLAVDCEGFDLGFSLAVVEGVGSFCCEV